MADFYRVRVTEDHIERGTPLNPYSCPIALALSEIRPRRRRKIVAGYSSIRFGKEQYDTPPDARAFMDRFDDGKAVRPFTFELKR